MSETYCPHCRGAMQNPPELAGKWVACPHCRQQFVISPPPPSPPALPAMYATQGYPPQYGGAMPYTGVNTYHTRLDLLSGVKTPILISGIFNSMWALALLVSCYGAIFAFPLVVLCVFEFVYFGTVDRQPFGRAISDGRLLGILEIVAGVLTCNPGVLVCGILAVTNAGQAERRYLALYR